MEVFKENRNYFFESFCDDSQNHATFEAIKGFLEDRKYYNANPLFIWGQAGSGKTHLMHGIVHEMLGSQKKVHYTTARGFINDFIGSLQGNTLLRNKTLEMREFYQNIDILIVEDVQFWSGKSRTQEEMTYILINRFENKKTTIFTSRNHPNQLNRFDEWLSSRMKMGLMLEVI